MEDLLNLRHNSHSIGHTTNGNIVHSTVFSDYSYYLTGPGIAYSVSSPFLLIGDCQPREAWLIHMAVVMGQMSDLLAQVLQYLVEAKCSFAIPESSAAHTMILNGSCGYQQVGKVMTIFPENPAEALKLARFLISATAEMMNPDIPSAIHLGGCVYVSHSESQTLGRRDLINHHKKSWPFKSIADFKIPKPDKWLNKKYFKVTRLKRDAKGNVYKALNFTKWMDIRWCIIKQGKKHQCMDHAGRDMGDRLRWQYQAQRGIAGKAAVPGAIDLFDINGDTYFVMEYVEGESYHNLISVIQQGIIWHALPGAAQILLTELSLQVIDVIGGLHRLGYVHRDLSPVNFMVRPDNRIVAIDIELSYHMARQEPEPHFTLGTAGYMSPQQRAGEAPVFEDDIFGIGALLFMTFTGISPTKFNLEDEQVLLESIQYFVRNRRLAALICACLNDDPGLRPDLQTIEHELQLYHTLVLTNDHLETLALADVTEPPRLKETITAAIQALISPPLLKDQMWFLKTRNEGHPIAGGFKSYSWYPGFYDGAAGCLYTLLTAVQNGYDAGDLRALIQSNHLLIRQHYEQQDNGMDAGLYHGASGFSVIIASMINTGLLENNNENLHQLIRLNALPNPNLHLADGIAGQGMAMMQCASLLNLPDLAAPAGNIAEVLISKQQNDGSWLSPSAGNKRPVKSYGLLNGVSGIAWFLMTYGFRYGDTGARNAAEKAIDWLLSQRKKSGAGTNWPLSSLNPVVDPWFENGFTGIAFLFIGAYAFFKQERFKTAVYETLANHPADITSNYISQAAGLTGLAEVCLEAYRVFGDEQWRMRARKIIELLIHTGKRTGNSGLYWVDGNDELPEPGFMTGQSGLIHLLMRYQHPELVSFPLISLAR